MYVRHPEEVEHVFLLYYMDHSILNDSLLFGCVHFPFEFTLFFAMYGAIKIVLCLLHQQFKKDEHLEDQLL